ELSTDKDILAYCQVIECGDHESTKIGKIRDRFEFAFLKAIWQAPSIIVLEDLDKIAPADGENADSEKSKQVVAVLRDLLKEYCLIRYDVALIATAVDKESLHPDFASTHTLMDFVHLSTPNKKQRQEMLAALLSGRPTQDLINLSEVASKTEGYYPADLKTLVSRTVDASLMRRMDSKLFSEEDNIIMNSDFAKALEDFVPAALKGVKLVDSGTSWADIGGLKETKRILIETLEWPTKYAAIFASCPLRLRSGVKGPEVLNKYIGASEQAIRDLFDRAQAAKPCILFFDEFESIAPRRGNDNTGVTDRVVNQLLTQMDGAEGLQGVYVLAATSRPDLIDPALLRPGRLDKSLLCSMPDVEDRKEILEAVSRKMNLAPDVDLLRIAQALDGFSGADVQGFMYSAYLEAVHEELGDQEKTEAQVKGKGKQKDSISAASDENKVEFKVIQPEERLSAVERQELTQRLRRIYQSSERDTDVNEDSGDKKDVESKPLLVYQRHLNAAIGKSKPSLGRDEVRRYERIFREFNGEEPATAPIVGKKTLMG
ncbi:Peroxisome biosynthesis protein pex1, partial [Chytridiales sp. JEL 0842]